MNPSRSTLPSRSWLVATVVPWLTASMSAPVAPSRPSTLSMPARKPSAGLLGVDGVFVEGDDVGERPAGVDADPDAAGHAFSSWRWKVVAVDELATSLPDATTYA